MTAVPFPPTPSRLDQIAVELRTTWGRVVRDIAATRALLIEAKEECRREGRSFDVWANSKTLPIGRSQIYNILDNRTSSHSIHPVDAIFSPDIALMRADGRWHGRGSDWASPQDLYDEYDRVFHFTLDVAANAQNAKCANFFTPEIDGLTQDWGCNICWGNYPYGSALAAWMKKAWESSLAGSTVVSLVPVSTDCDWWWAYAVLGEIRFIKEQVRFIKPDGETVTLMRPSAIVIFRPPDRTSNTQAGRGHLRSKNDDVPTHESLARRIVEHFPISGKSLDPCRGYGAFFDALPDPKFWCEIKEGRDFLDWTMPVDWIVSNIPWSAELYRAISRHAFEISNNVVFLTRWHTATATYARHRDWLDAGHAWRETVYIPWKDAGFLDKHGDEKSEGFILAAFWWQRGWTDGMTETYWT